VNDFVYAAGFIDGEGTIGVDIKDSIAKSGKLYTAFGCFFQIVNTYEPIIRHLRNVFDSGKVSQRVPKSKKAKLQWYLDFRSYEIKTALEKVYPYLIVKRKQADLMFKFLEIKGARGDKDIDPDLVRQRIDIALELQILNERGR